MRISRKVSYAAGVLLALLAIVLQQNVSAAKTDQTVHVSSTATKPVTPGPLLDDFRYSTALNLWACHTST